MNSNFTKFWKISVATIFLVIVVRKTSGQDLPGVSPNLINAPAGTLVIAMDNTNQSCNTINPGTGTYLFNLSAYGLSIYMLNATYTLSWVISAGKTKDAVDFTATAERITPTYQAPQSLGFKAGPLLIFPVDTAGAYNTIQSFNSSLSDSSKVKVYRLTSSATVDVRYNLSRSPKAALLHDFCDIHAGFMRQASVPLINYDCLPNASTLRSGCYSIATVPHSVPSDLTSYDSDSIYNFIMAGGNFLAECEGIQTFENLRSYHSGTGVIVDPSGGQYNNFNNNVYYDNPDMAYGQYEGTFRPWTRGAQKVWRYGSTTINNFYSVTSTKRNAADNLYYVAGVSKMTTGLGSLVFYLGNHEYFTNTCQTCTSGNAINEAEINGIRLFLNAVLIPSNPWPCLPLPVELSDFTAEKINTDKVGIEWEILNEKENTSYFIEHSTDSRSFFQLGHIRGNNQDETSEYEFLHKSPVAGMNYYRLRIEQATGKITYSKIIPVSIDHKIANFKIFPNPATGFVILKTSLSSYEQIEIRIKDLSGRTVFSQKTTMQPQIRLNTGALPNGMYWTMALRENGEIIRNKLIINR